MNTIANSENAGQWHPTKNGNLLPEMVTLGSHKKVWWLCPKGHEWEATVGSRTKGSGCPYCSGYLAIPGETDLATVSPELAAQWHPLKNGNLRPETITANRRKAVWWLGGCGHEWETPPYKRYGRGDGCPYCSNKKLLVGYNDLQTVHPDLASEWDAERNSLSPSQVLAVSQKNYSWKCSNGHTWDTSPSRRLRTRKTGDSVKQPCPYCSGRKVLSGVNDLQTLYPNIASQWHPTKNESLTPAMVGKGSDKKVWWQCSEGHEWESWVYVRTAPTPHACPHCASLKTASAGEEEVASYLEEIGFQIVRNARNILPRQELDIYVPEKKIAIEYNGLYWHSESAGKDHNYHYDKWAACQSKGIQLIQIWEDDWMDRPSIVKTMLKHKLGGETQARTYARETQIHRLDYSQAFPFLETNHIQGACTGTYYLALKKDEEIVAVMVLTRKNQDNDEELILDRFATSTSVPGGFTRLLSYTLKNFPAKKIITYSDNAVSNGGLYENNGFVRDGEIPPDYCYLANRKRVHKFNYRLSRFKQDSNLIYIEGKSERELALLNNLPRIWDAGKIRWVLTRGKNVQ